MGNHPLISVIIPCYNDGKYIIECLNSVHNQSYENYELIIINDGSDDAYTNKVISEISHPKVKIINTKNQGVSLARNLGINQSNGKYILPLDADNKVSDNFIGEAINILEIKQHIKIVNCDLIYFGAKKGYKKFESFSLENLICKNVIESASIYRRTDFNKTIGYNPNMTEGLEDWDFWLSMLENGGDVYKLDFAGIYYRVRRNSRNNSITSDQFKRLRQQLYNNHKELYSKHLLDPQMSFEYELITQSKEYRLGKFLLKPIRTLYESIFF